MRYSELHDDVPQAVDPLTGIVVMADQRRHHTIPRAILAAKRTSTAHIHTRRTEANREDG